ncbi:MAG TPA: alpha/beta fold hydrolase [Galbitalea sp.]|jgi:pimeloyl-ACP methyl ester carboxylesterase|nr:alpha/beta fold hydrolase [Galbitalea sp.]
MSNTTFTQVTELGSGRPALVLHGGGGPFTVAPLVQHLAETTHVIAPTHPGFNGTPTDASITSVRSLADAYADFLIERDLHGVIVVGSSVGGWLAAELALGSAADRIAGIVLINGVGVQVDGHSVRSLAGLTPQEIAQFSFHDPLKLQVPPPTPEGIAIAKGNAATLAALSGPDSVDPTLLGRLAAAHAPALVIWGVSDRVVDEDYGRAFAAAIPGAEFTLIPDAGHLPYLENAAEVWAALDPFVASH